MTVIFGANLIEEVLLVSDGRSTRRTGDVSDTATKIVPIRPFLAVAITGNPKQAAEILSEVKKEIEKIEESYKISRLHGISSDVVKDMAIAVGDKILPVDIQDSRCRLVFAGVDPLNQQTVTVGQVKHFLDSKHSGNGMLIPGFAGAKLSIYAAQSKKHDEIIGLPFPSTYLFSFSWPTKEIKDVPCLEMACWGSGSNLVETHLRPDFPAFWQVSEGNAFMKKGILAITLKDVFQGGSEKGVGGLPQIVSVGIKDGVMFQGYSNDKIEMIYENDAWIQKDKKTGKAIKTLASLMDLPSFDPSEIVDWLDEF